MPAKARLPSGTLVEVLCGQPEQKYGVRLIGATGCICVASRPLNQSALARSISAISGLRLRRSSRSVSELASDATLSSAANVRKRLSCSSILPTMRGRTSSRQLNSSCLTWFSTISRRSSTMKISSSPTAKFRTPSGSIGAGKCDRGKSLVVLQAQVLLVAIIGPAQVETTRRHLEIGRDDEGLHLVGEIDLGGGLHCLGNHLHADPASGIARHRDAEQAHLDHFVDAGGIEIGHQRGDKGMIGLMRHSGGFCAVIVAGETEHAAVFRRARGIGVTKHVAAAVNARSLAIPDADDAVVLGAGGEIELLG